MGRHNAIGSSMAQPMADKGQTGSVHVRPDLKQIESGHFPVESQLLLLLLFYYYGPVSEIYIVACPSFDLRVCVATSFFIY